MKNALGQFVKGYPVKVIHGWTGTPEHRAWIKRSFAMQVEHEEQYNGERERNQTSMTCRKWVKIGNSHRHSCWKAKGHPGPCECSCWFEFSKGE